MSSPGQRARWERKARWLAELGLAEGESAAVEVIEDVASAALSLLDEVGRLEARLAWLSRAVAEGWPTVATDLTFVRVNGGVVSTTLAHWDGERLPLVGDRVVVGDGGPLMNAVVTAVEDDALRLQVDLGDDRSGPL